MHVLQILPHIIQNSAAKHPEKEAFRCNDSTITYQELDQKAEKLALYLNSVGVKKGDRVGIYMNRCLETAIAVYGILYAGAAYVPLDPDAPLSRIRFLIEDCGIKQLVSVPRMSKKVNALVEQLGLNGVVGVSVDSVPNSMSWEALCQIEFSTQSIAPVLESDLAYIMYTSGSTGAPKGIMHTHASGLAYAKKSAEVYGLTPEDRVANHAPLHFDISTFGYFSAPLAGSCTVIIPDAHTKLPASLSELMEREKINIWYSVPLALIQLLEKGVLQKRNLSALRWILYGGEVFPPKYLKRLRAIWPKAIFSNVYGPAEVNQCTYHNFTEIQDEDSQIPLGKVWDIADYRILNEQDTEVSAGQTGELVVSTASMMKGYWNNEVLTMSSVYHEKDKEGRSQKFYRTGDLVHLRPDGTLLFMGRNDRQIKFRGYRVELDEIEAVLHTHTAVSEAAVFVTKDESENSKIGTAIILADGEDITEVELKGFCKTQLPTYAVPEEIILVDEFPRTSSGKIKRSEIEKLLID